MNRRDLMKLAAAQTTLVALPALAAIPSTTAGHSTIVLRNSQFELLLTSGTGLHCRLVHRPTGTILADGDYSYSFGSLNFTEVRKEDGAVVLHGITASGMGVRHRFSVEPTTLWMEEELELTNNGATPLDLHDARVGFVLPLQVESGKVQSPWAEYKFTAIPFRREPRGYQNQYADFSVHQVLTEQFSSDLWSGETTVSSAYAAEGWAWTNGEQGFLISKYSPGGVEFAVLDRVALAHGQPGLRWGGAGIYRNNPEHGAWLKPGETHRFGVTRLTAFRGDRLRGFYTWRSEMEERGHGCPAGFNPPVHWNEIYDNALWWLPGHEQNDPAMRKKYYSFESMKEEAAKAKAIGCEALYMDPGWDTNFGSKIWDEARLTPYKSFTTMLAFEYGLKSSLHTPLSGWCDPSSYPEAAYRLDRFGRRATWGHSDGFGHPPLCGASQQYVEETASRLKNLARDGAAFFMFDGTAYHEECWDLKHGHPIPARLEEHCQATCGLARMVHAEFPDVLIEMHDPAVGGAPIRGVPIYYGHGRGLEGQPDSRGNGSALGFDTVWAFELMWQPMDDLLSGHSIALYYYNLAYSLPLYIHIDLRTDNENAVVFWWNASTCRHLGIGGTHPDAAVRTAQKEGMANYRRLKPYFASGIFYGIDEQTHVHTDREGKSAVLNCFNLDDKPVEREIHFAPAQLGLLPSRRCLHRHGTNPRAGTHSG